MGKKRGGKKGKGKGKGDTPTCHNSGKVGHLKNECRALTNSVQTQHKTMRAKAKVKAKAKAKAKTKDLAAKASARERAKVRKIFNVLHAVNSGILRPISKQMPDHT